VACLGPDKTGCFADSDCNDGRTCVASQCMDHASSALTPPGSMGAPMAGSPGSTDPAPHTDTKTLAPPQADPVSWETGRVVLSADAFEIEAGTKNFFAQNTPVDLHSDPGNATYWTFEATWLESGVEMRLNLYFAADNAHWWVNEIRTYNGAAQGDWIYYKGTFFKTPIGQQFQGDVSLESNDGPIQGKLHFANLHLVSAIPVTNGGPCLLAYNGAPLDLGGGATSTPNQCCFKAGGKNTCNLHAKCGAEAGANCCLVYSTPADGFGACCAYENGTSSVDARCAPLLTGAN
jgi:hypothetical protein